MSWAVVIWDLGIRLKATDDSGFAVPFDLPLDPRTDKSTLFSIHILSIVDRWPITSEYFSFLFTAIIVLGIIA